MRRNLLPNIEFFSISLILIAIASRFIPHPPNFTPIISISLLAGYSFRNKLKSFLIPLVSMFVSDLFLGLHFTIWAVYLSFVIVVFLGFLLRNNFNYIRLFGLVSISSLLFYLVTNFAVWATSGMYPHTLAGLLQCYFFGLPFYKPSPIEMFGLAYLGDLIYSFTLFVAYDFAAKRIYAHKQNP
ncbi:MAG: DUF6580 family putative transport protein [Candidatus Kapaibacteriota bacterium]